MEGFSFWESGVTLPIVLTPKYSRSHWRSITTCGLVLLVSGDAIAGISYGIQARLKDKTVVSGYISWEPHDLWEIKHTVGEADPGVVKFVKEKNWDEDFPVPDDEEAFARWLAIFNKLGDKTALGMVGRNPLIVYKDFKQVQYPTPTLVAVVDDIVRLDLRNVMSMEPDTRLQLRTGFPVNEISREDYERFSKPPQNMVGVMSDTSPDEVLFMIYGSSAAMYDVLGHFERSGSRISTVDGIKIFEGNVESDLRRVASAEVVADVMRFLRDRQAYLDRLSPCERTLLPLREKLDQVWRKDEEKIPIQAEYNIKSKVCAKLKNRLLGQFKDLGSDLRPYGIFQGAVPGGNDD